MTMIGKPRKQEKMEKEKREERKLGSQENRQGIRLPERRRGELEIQDQTRPAVSDQYFRFEPFPWRTANARAYCSGSALTALQGANIHYIAERSSAWEFFFFFWRPCNGLFFSQPQQGG